MEYRDVKLRIVLDASAAAGAADVLATPQPANPGGPALPGQPAPDAGAGAGRAGPAAPAVGADGTTAGPRGGTGGQGATDAQRVADVLEGRVARKIEGDVEKAVMKRLGEGGVLGRTALGVAASARSGGLSTTVIGSVPFAGLAVTAAEYGPAVGAAVEELVPPGVRPLAAAARKSAEGTARTIATGRSYLDAVGEALDETAAAASVMARAKGHIDVDFLKRFAAAKYDIAQQMQEAESFRRIYQREKLGQAAGGVIEDMAARLKAGLVQAVGR